MRVAPFIQNREKPGIDHRDMLCTSIRGSTGRGTGFGRLRLSAASFGDTRRIAGIYQKRKLSVDKSRYDGDLNPAYPYVAMRTYRPTYSNTEVQQENRAKIAAAVEFWQGLTDEEKHIYNQRGVRKRLSGYNVCVSEFIKYYDESE